MKETTKNTLNDLKKLGIALASAFVIYKVGSSESVAIIGVVPAITYSAAYFIAKAKNGKASWKDGLLWGVIGLAAGIGFYAAI